MRMCEHTRVGIYVNTLELMYPRLAEMREQRETTTSQTMGGIKFSDFDFLIFLKG